jgi:hypothetical protein
MDPKILGVTVKKLVATATWCPGFVHSCSKVKADALRTLRTLHGNQVESCLNNYDAAEADPLEIWELSSHEGECEGYDLLGCDAV